MKKFLLGFFSMIIVFSPSSVGAQGISDATKNLETFAGPGKTGLSADLPGTAASVVSAALVLVGTIFLLLTIYAGILWMTARGEEEQIEKSKKIITATIIGLFITMSAYAITFFVTSRLSGADGGPGGGCCITVGPSPGYQKSCQATTKDACQTTDNQTFQNTACSGVAACSQNPANTTQSCTRNEDCTTGSKICGSNGKCLQ